MNVTPRGINGLVMRTFPAADGAFARAVADAADVMDVLDPASMERILRERYPSVAVRPSVIQDPWTVWYVYRDGRWTSGELEASVVTA